MNRLYKTYLLLRKGSRQALKEYFEALIESQSDFTTALKINETQHIEFIINSNLGFDTNIIRGDASPFGTAINSNLVATAEILGCSVYPFETLITFGNVLDVNSEISDYSAELFESLTSIEDGVDVESEVKNSSANMVYVDTDGSVDVNYTTKMYVITPDTFRTIITFSNIGIEPLVTPVSYEASMMSSYTMFGEVVIPTFGLTSTSPITFNVFISIDEILDFNFATNSYVASNIKFNIDEGDVLYPTAMLLSATTSSFSTFIDIRDEIDVTPIVKKYRANKLKSNITVDDVYPYASLYNIVGGGFAFIIDINDFGAILPSIVNYEPSNVAFNISLGEVVIPSIQVLSAEEINLITHFIFDDELNILPKVVNYNANEFETLIDIDDVTYEVEVESNSATSYATDIKLDNLEVKATATITFPPLTYFMAHAFFTDDIEMISNVLSYEAQQFKENIEVDGNINPEAFLLSGEINDLVAHLIFNDELVESTNLADFSADLFKHNVTIDENILDVETTLNEYLPNTFKTETNLGINLTPTVHFSSSTNDYFSAIIPNIIVKDELVSEFDIFESNLIKTISYIDNEVYTMINVNSNEAESLEINFVGNHDFHSFIDDYEETRIDSVIIDLGEVNMCSTLVLTSSSVIFATNIICEYCTVEHQVIPYIASGPVGADLLSEGTCDVIPYVISASTLDCGLLIDNFYICETIFETHAYDCDWYSYNIINAGTSKLSGILDANTCENIYSTLFIPFDMSMYSTMVLEQGAELFCFDLIHTGTSEFTSDLITGTSVETSVRIVNNLNEFTSNLIDTTWVETGVCIDDFIICDMDVGSSVYDCLDYSTKNTNIIISELSSIFNNYIYNDLNNTDITTNFDYDMYSGMFLDESAEMFRFDFPININFDASANLSIGNINNFSYYITSNLPNYDVNYKTTTYDAVMSQLNTDINFDINFNQITNTYEPNWFKYIIDSDFDIDMTSQLKVSTAAYTDLQHQQIDVDLEAYFKAHMYLIASQVLDLQYPTISMSDLEYSMRSRAIDTDSTPYQTLTIIPDVSINSSFETSPEMNQFKTVITNVGTSDMESYFCYSTFAKLNEYNDLSYTLGSIGNSTLNELSYHKYNY